VTIFRNKNDGYLYTMYFVKPMRYTGRWYEVFPLFPGKGQHVKYADLNDFNAIAER